MIRVWYGMYLLWITSVKMWKTIYPHFHTLLIHSVIQKFVKRSGLNENYGTQHHVAAVYATIAERTVHSRI